MKLIEDAWGPHPLQFRPDQRIGARRRGMLRPNAVSIHKHVFGCWRWRCGGRDGTDICWGDDRGNTFTEAVADAVAHARQVHGIRL